MQQVPRFYRRMGRFSHTTNHCDNRAKWERAREANWAESWDKNRKKRVKVWDVDDMFWDDRYEALVSADGEDGVVGGWPPSGGVDEHVDRLVGDGGGGCWVNMTSRSTVLKTCWRESNARPESSLSIRSGRSWRTVFNFKCLSPLCQRGIKCSILGHTPAIPSSLHFVQARVTLRVVNMGSPVVLSRILSSRVKKLISLVTVLMASRLVVPTMRRGNTVS